LISLNQNRFVDFCDFFQSGISTGNAEAIQMDKSLQSDVGGREHECGDSKDANDAEPPQSQHSSNSAYFTQQFYLRIFLI
jgi:hypothetical protein